MQAGAEHPTRQQRRRAGLIGLALFALAVAFAPIVDAALHGTGAADASADLHECVACQLTTTPASAADPPAALSVAASATYVPRFAIVTVQLLAAPPMLTPPTRGPPA